MLSKSVSIAALFVSVFALAPPASAECVSYDDSDDVLYSGDRDGDGSADIEVFYPQLIDNVEPLQCGNGSRPELPRVIRIS